MSILVLVVVLSTLACVIALRSHLHKRHPHTKPFISALGTVNTPLDPDGSILINGELWLARSANLDLIPARTRVIVVGVRDHLLLVTQS